MGSSHEVILVNEEDEMIGTMEKMEAHRKALLHRAFSVFIFNDDGDMLLQQRAEHKYHSGGLWTNACCSHPYPGETVETAASRRLREELGFSVPLTEIFTFTYRSDFDNGLTEHEYDHVFAGRYNGPVSADPAEVKDHAFRNIDVLERSLQLEPQKYSSWFLIAFPKIKNWLMTADNKNQL